MRFRSHWLIVGLVLLFSACEGERGSEFYGDLLSSPLGLTLAQSEHETGWGRSDCYSCHATENFHIPRPERRDTYDMEAIQQQVEEEGLSSCSSCHGNNGVVSP